ncbi:MAG: SMP-30/gluconolactonase/LRE family protein [Christensenella sp.]|nr:SMP-30/gluconolactonase/LRE family protein [Christensenella sp.]
MKFNLCVDARLCLSETPIWDDRLRQLYWTDTLGGIVHRYDPATGDDTSWKTGQPVGSAIPCSDPNFMLCALEDGLYLLNLSSGALTFVSNPETRPGFRYNDTRVDAAGRIFTSSVSTLYGSPEYREEITGKFYMIDTDGSISVIAPAVNQYNGIVWNRDNTKMFVVDTYFQKLLVFPFSLSTVPSASEAISIDVSPFGMPDGISINEEDELFLCHWSGKISHWRKQLQLESLIPFPVEYPCCGGFGGTDKKCFYVASSAFQYTPVDFERNPGAGGIFEATCRIPGCLDHFYPVR